MHTTAYGRLRGTQSSLAHASRSVTSRRACRCRTARNDAQSDVPTVDGQHGSSAGDRAVIDDANQEQIAKAAALVLSRAKAVLTEKLEEYESELQQLETAASRNFVYRYVGRSRLFSHLGVHALAVPLSSTSKRSIAPTAEGSLQGYQCVDHAAASTKEGVCQSTHPNDG